MGLCCGNAGAGVATIIATSAAAGVILFSGAFADEDSDRAQQGAQGREAVMSMNLPARVAETEGCLGVETARTSSGKNVIFAWFEDKKAVENWYYSETHQGAMKRFFPDHSGEHKPLEGVADDAGPLMVIASITMAEQGAFEETSLSISQISIEVYEPVTGGIFLGERFAPDGMKVPGMKDYTQPGVGG